MQKKFLLVYDCLQIRDTDAWRHLLISDKKTATRKEKLDRLIVNQILLVIIILEI